MATRFDTIQKDLRRIRLRFLVLVPIILACVLITRAHILSVGGVAEVDLPEFAGYTITADSIQVDPPGIVEFDEAWTDDVGIPHIRFSAGTPGKGMVLVSLEGAGGAFEMQTTANGVVVSEGFDVTGWEYICTSIAIVVICTGALCASAAFSLWRRAWFDYEMAAYIGSALFFLLQTFLVVIPYMSGTISAFSEFALAVISMAGSFVDYSAIPMAVIAFFVSVSNVSLLRHEGRAFTNLLGVIATILWAGAFFGLHAFRDFTSGFFMNPVLYALLDSALSAVLAYTVALFLGVCITALLAAFHTPSFPRDYLVILGCGLRDDGTPTPLLAGRVDAALAYAAQQGEAGHATPTFVPSGGQGSDEVCSEAASMARYIQEHDAGARILPEDRSTTTRENMAFSEKVIRADAAGEDPRIAFSTTNYHVLRGYVFAHMAGMDAEGIAAPTKLYFWPNAFLREFVGMLAARALVIAFNCVAIVGVYTILEYLLITR